MKHDPQIIATHLSAIRAPWHLCAIQNGNSKPKGIWTDDIDKAIAFAIKWNMKEWNLYWTTNPLMRDPGPKPAEKDVLQMDWIHVDIDPRERENLADEQERIRQLLEVYEPKPSLVVFSGGGYQAFWRLEKPIPLNGREELYRDAKLYNKQMGVMFDADACQNTDRLMRLPGTVNWPSAKKLTKGRSATLATIVDQNDLTYPIEKFMKAVEVQQATGFKAQTVQVSGNVKRLDDLKDLTVSDDCKRVISQGHHPDDPMRWDGDRSKAQWWVTCEMVRGGIDDDTIFSILTDPDWGISGHVRDQPRPEEYAVRQIEKAREEAVAPELRMMNDQYAVVKVGSKVRILCEEVVPGEEYPSISFLTKADLELLHFSDHYTYTDSDGKDHFVPLPKWWLLNKLHRQYKGVVFLPGQDSRDYYNMWRGFAFEARDGDCSPFLDHIRDNICQKDKELYDYIVGWMAHAVQHPDQPGHTAVVFRGKQGTGKGFFANHFGRLFGRHFLPVRDSNHIFGQFNGHLQDCVVLFADESFWTSNKKQTSMLKNLITEPEMLVERKGVDAMRSKNCVHLIMASNDDWVVPVEGNDRRFFVLDVGEEHMQDSVYFKRIADQMENGGYEALLFYLLNYDLSDYDVRTIPTTAAAQEQKNHTRVGKEAWWFEKLCDGQVYSDGNGWPQFVYRTEMLGDMIAYHQMFNRNLNSCTPIVLGMFMKKVLPRQVNGALRGKHTVRQLDGTVTQKEGLEKIYELGTLEECREIWESKYGRTCWPEPLAETAIEEHEATIPKKKEPF